LAAIDRPRRYDSNHVAVNYLSEAQSKLGTKVFHAVVAVSKMDLG